MRLFLIILLIGVAAAVGLYVYGSMLQPDVTTIELEATGAPAEQE
ncbi:MAG: hypothetical protein AAF850_09540 [Pseudomonadota bacterium]